MIDHIETISVFQNYSKEYNEALKDIDRKILHTFRVAKNAETIAQRLGMESKLVKSVFDNTILYCCMAFDLELEVTRTIVKDQGYLLQILQSGQNDKQIEQLRITSAEIEKAWGFSL